MRTKYVIYQLKNMRNTAYGFMSWKFAAKNGFSIRDYEKVYDGEKDGTISLESMFAIFNTERPADFKGHSLSMSDIVAVKSDEDKDWHYHYCDSFGWADITETVNEQQKKTKRSERAAEIAKRISDVNERFDPYNQLGNNGTVEEIKGQIEKDPLEVIENLLQIAEEMLNREY